MRASSAAHGAGMSLRRRNVGPTDRLASAMLGVGALMFLRGRHRSLASGLMAVAGVSLIARAMSGHSKIYQLAGVSSESLDHGAGINIETAITIDRPRDELYEFWSDLRNLPVVMHHLESVEPVGEGVTRWTALGPRNMVVTWDARVINEQPGRFIAWSSLPGSDIDQSGSVHFEDAGDKGTELRLKLRYVPKGMEAGFGIAKILNPITQAEVDEDLRRFKRAMELGSPVYANVEVVAR